MKKSIILLLILFLISVLVEAQQPIPITSLARSSNPLMTIQTNASRYQSYQYFTTAWGDTLLNFMQANPNWLGTYLPAGAVNIAAAGNNLQFTQGGTFRWTGDTTSLGEWIPQFTVSPLLSGGLINQRLIGVGSLANKYIGTSGQDNIGLYVDGYPDIYLRNSQVQDGELSGGGYIPFVDDDGKITLTKGDSGVWIKPVMETGNDVVIASTNSLIIAEDETALVYSQINNLGINVASESDNKLVNVTVDGIEMGDDNEGNYMSLDNSVSSINIENGTNGAVINLKAGPSDAYLEIAESSGEQVNVLADQIEQVSSGTATTSTLANTSLEKTGTESAISETVRTSTRGFSRTSTYNNVSDNRAAGQSYERTILKSNIGINSLDATNTILMSTPAANTTDAPKIILSKSSLSSPGTNFSTTYPSVGSLLGEYIFASESNLNWISNAKITANATENQSVSAQGTSLSLWTTPNGTASQVERLKIEEDGDILQSDYPSTRNDSGEPTNLYFAQDANGTQGVKQLSNVFQYASFEVTGTNDAYTGQEPIHGWNQIGTSGVTGNVTIQGDTMFQFPTTGVYEVEFNLILYSLATQSDFTLSINNVTDLTGYGTGSMEGQTQLNGGLEFTVKYILTATSSSAQFTQDLLGTGVGTIVRTGSRCNIKRLY